MCTMFSIMAGLVGMLTYFTSLPFITVASPPKTPGEWRALVTKDVAAAHEALVENSPIMIVDRDSKAPRKWLEEGYRQALARIPQVTDAASASAVLKAYAGGFRDSHISVQTTPEFSTLATENKKWPGFATAWRGTGY